MRNRRAFVVLMANQGGGVSTYTVSGIVYDADGTTPVEGATVALGPLSAVSVVDGTYTISGVAAGTSGSMTCTKTGYLWTAKTIAAITESLTAQNYSNAWWAGAGAGASIGAVWQPAGAVSLAASYLRIAGSLGNANLDPAVVGGVAPAWNATDGWIGNEVSRYLKTGVIPETNWSWAVSYKDTLDGSAQYIFGSSNGASAGFGCIGSLSSTVYYVNGGPKNISPALLSGKLGAAGSNGYRNGVLDTNIIPAWSGTGFEIYLLCRNLSGSPIQYTRAKIQMVSFWTTDISTKMAMVVAGMSVISP